MHTLLLPARVQAQGFLGILQGAIAHGLVAGIRDKRLGDGFVEAIGLCGAILARHFPAGDNNPNELPDRPIVL